MGWTIKVRAGTIPMFTSWQIKNSGSGVYAKKPQVLKFRKQNLLQIS